MVLIQVVVLFTGTLTVKDILDVTHPTNAPV
jgi:hypothetical protein